MGVPMLGCWAQLHPATGWPPSKDLGRIWPRVFYYPLRQHSTWWRCCVMPTTASSSTQKGQLCFGGQLGSPQEHLPAESWQQVGV